MAIDINKVKAAAQAAAQTITKNMHDTVASSYQLPAPGKALARLVGVIEIGEHEVKGGPGNMPKVKDRIRFIFELFGKKYPRTKGEDGTEYPVRISRSVTNSRHEKSTLHAWVTAMDPEKKYSHPVQMIGDSFIVDIEHKEFPDGKIAFIKSVEAAVKRDLDTGDETPIEAPAPLSELMFFLWENPTLEMWNSLYIPGEFDGNTKNVLQEMITDALNFEGSPAAKMLKEALDNGEVVKGLNWPEGADAASGAADKEAPAAKEAPAPQKPAAKAVEGLDDEEELPAKVPEQKAASAAPAKPEASDEPVERSAGKLPPKAASRLAALLNGK